MQFIGNAQPLAEVRGRVFYRVTASVLNPRGDVIRVTGAMFGALQGYFVVDTEDTRAASDHLPAGVRYEPSAIG